MVEIFKKFLDYSSPTAHIYSSSMLSGGLWSYPAEILKATDRQYVPKSLMRGLLVGLAISVPTTLLAKGIEKVSKSLYPPKQENLGSLMTEAFDKHPLLVLIGTVLPTMYGYQKGKKLLLNHKEDEAKS